MAGVEFDLLSMARQVTSSFSSDLVEKIVVPTERHLRSHGDKKKVVDVKVRYPGYVFCKIRLTEEVYEVLQELELTRSWMGTVNRKGYKKLPPVPLPLNDEEVAKFKGLEKEAEMFEDMYGEDYSGRSDSGEDLLAQYAGYEVGQMVKILSGNFEGEDGTVRRLKDGQIMVRMFTYGQTFDNWFDPDAIRPLTDLEVMRGLSGPTKPIDQDQFDVSIGKKDASVLSDDTREGRAGLLQSAGAGDSGRNRRQDRIARGETGRDLFGRTPEEIKQEEANWLAYREEKRAGQRAAPTITEVAATKTKKKKEEGPKKGHDTWGIVERSSWDGGEYGFENYTQEERAARKRLEEMYQDRGEFRSYDRRNRRESRFDNRDTRPGRDFNDSRQRPGRDDSRGPRSFNDRQRRDFGDRQQGDRERRPVREPQKFRDGDRFGRSRRVKEEDWESKSEAVNNNDPDDFFSSLMKELKDDVDSSSQRGRGTRHHDNAGPNERSRQSDDSEDSFFENLMSELGSSLDSDASNERDDAGGDSDDDFFASLENELSSSLNGESKLSSGSDANDNDDDDAFFASLQSELTSSLSGESGDMDDFFASTKGEKISSDASSFEDDFFGGLMDDVADELEKTESKRKTTKPQPVKVVKASDNNNSDLNSMTVPELKEMLKKKGLKVGGKKAELIERLQSST